MNIPLTNLIPIIIATILSATPSTVYTQSHDVIASPTISQVEINPPSNPGNIGFLVVAPDRGFLGNEEIRDAFAGFSEYYRADLAFIPWHRDPLRYVTPAIEGLERRSAERVAVLPLAAPKFRRLERMNYRLTQVLEHP